MRRIDGRSQFALSIPGDHGKPGNVIAQLGGDLSAGIKQGAAGIPRIIPLALGDHLTQMVDMVARHGRCEMASEHLTLSQALKLDRLPEFVAQAEAHGTDSADRVAFDATLRAAVKEKPAARRTSGSRKRDDSSGSRTRRGKAAASRG